MVTNQGLFGIEGITIWYNYMQYFEYFLTGVRELSVLKRHASVLQGFGQRQQ